MDLEGFLIIGLTIILFYVIYFIGKIILRHWPNRIDGPGDWTVG